MAASKSVVKIKGLKVLSSKLDVTRRRLAAAHRKEANEKKLAAQRKEGHLASERKLFEKKLEIARQIFEWGKAFTKTKEYLQLEKIRKQNFLLDASSLQIYSGGWGHKEPGYHKYGGGDWSKFSLNSDGTFTYAAGHKWMSTETRRLRNSKALAALNYNYLKELRESLYNSDEPIKQIIDKLKRG